MLSEKKKEILWRRMQRIYTLLLTGFCDSNRTVWMLHEVKDNIEEADNPKYCITTNQFIGFINTVKVNGYNIVSPERLLFEKNKSGLITFDDGYEDIYLRVAPFLTKMKIPFTVFVTVDFLDKPGFLTREQLRDLADNEYCIIGSHTMSHPHLRFCSNSNEEISKSKEELERILQKEVSYFAYPYGVLFACSLKNLREVKRAGYRLAFSTIQTNIPKKFLKNIFFLPRFNVTPEYIQEFEKRK